MSSSGVSVESVEKTSTTTSAVAAMEIVLSQAELLRELTATQGVVERKTTIPILSNVLIEAAKSGLRLTATDLDIQIVEALHSDVLRAGSATA